MLNANEIQTAALELVPAIRGMLAKIAHCEADIDDAAQEGFIYLVTYALPRWRGEGSLKTFALTSVKRQYIKERMRHFNSRRKEFPQEGGDWGTDASAFLEDWGAVDALARAIELEWLTVALDALTSEERALCEAFKATGEWKLAAERIGVSAPTACRMRARIQAKLAK